MPFWAPNGDTSKLPHPALSLFTIIMKEKNGAAPNVIELSLSKMYTR